MSEIHAETLMKKLQPMVEIEDVLIESYLLNTLKQGNAQSAIEFGAGNAGWPLMMNLMGFTSPQWHLVEDFSLAMQTQSQKIRPDWATNPDELTQHIAKNSSEFKLNRIIPSLPNDDREKYDICRIDFRLDPEWVEKFVSEQMSDDAWLFIDDTKMNCGFERIMLAFRLMNAGLVYPIWIGEKECVFSKNKYDGQKVIAAMSSFPSQHINLYTRVEGFQNHSYAVTTLFKISDESVKCI